MDEFLEPEREFDPEFSEFNPIFAELKELKAYVNTSEDTGLVASLIRKLMPCCIVD